MDYKIKLTEIGLINLQATLESAWEILEAQAELLKNLYKDIVAQTKSYK